MKWPLRPLSELVTITSGKTPSRGETRYWGGEVPWISPKDVKRPFLSSSEEKVTQAALAERAVDLLPAGVVLVVVRGMILAHTLPVAQATVPATINQDIKALTACDEVEPAFLMWMVRACAADLLHAVSVAGHGTRRLETDVLLACRVPAPPINEQRRIVAAIRNAMERVEEVERSQSDQRGDSERLLPSSLAEVFEPIGAKYPAEPIGDLLADCRYGTSQKCRSEADDVAVLRIPNVSSGELDLSDLKYCSRAVLEDGSLLEDGDLLIIRTNGSPALVGRCIVYEQARAKDLPTLQVSFASYLIRLRFDRARCLPAYARFFLSSSLGRRAINDIRRSSAGQSNINSAKIKAIPLPLPPVHLQRSIVEELAGVERVARSLIGETQAMREPSQLRAAILRQAFSGGL